MFELERNRIQWLWKISRFMLSKLYSTISIATNKCMSNYTSVLYYTKNA